MSLMILQSAYFAGFPPRRSRLQRVSLGVFMFCCLWLAAMYLTGCAGTVLNDAVGVIETALGTLGGISGILAFIPGIGTAAAVIGKILTDAVGTLQEVKTLVQQYTTTPSETLLQKIEAAVQLATTNLGPLLAPEGVPTAAAQKIGQIVQAVLDEIEAWVSTIEGLKPVTTPAPAAAVAGVAAARVAHVTHVVKKPMTSSAFVDHINGLLEAPTGDEGTDAAFAKVPRLKKAA